ncbi:hypothetical protein [Roseibium aggregatum]|uniref:hypothetical protein n=1 Tax=Roseibium aggregatum TaxID=187304 RepID=UPI0025ABF7DF|nr:hypothetical protein [Roseibium aggregatum]WJS01841.1 hypothetical protein QUB73_22110 [Roseibium aggregatum]
MPGWVFSHCGPHCSFQVTRNGKFFGNGATGYLPMEKADQIFEREARWAWFQKQTETRDTSPTQWSNSAWHLSKIGEPNQTDLLAD